MNKVLFLKIGVLRFQNDKNSSIKYLSTEKSAMASGIINAARQIGTCIGIAVLSSILNSNVTNATNSIKQDVTTKINSQVNLDPIIKEEILTKINSFNGP